MDETNLVDAGVQALVDKLGVAETERFIALMNREPFDYTEWHGLLSEGKTVEEIHERAAKNWNAEH